MDSNKFKVEVVTPDGVVFSEDIVSLKVPGTEGMFGVLVNHAPFMTGITIGTIEVNTGAKITYIAASGGFAEVMPDKTTIMAETAEIGGKIDIERAQEARNRAQERLFIKAPEVDIDRAQLALARAINRIRVAAMK